MYKQNKINQNQSGFASMVVAITIVIILALITVGFAKLARHEQNSALNKQLSTQAYYAAESGINDSYNDIQNKKITSSGTEPTAILAANETKCMRSNDTRLRISKHDLTADGGISYSCVLIDLTPTTLDFQIPRNSDRTLSFSAEGVSNGAPVDVENLTVTWETNSGTAKVPRPANDESLTPNSQWNSPAVLQFRLVRVSGNNISINQPSFTTYMYPSLAGSDSNEVAFSESLPNQGDIISGHCSAAGVCSVKITGLNLAGTNSYLMHVYSYYDNAKITVKVNDGTTDIYDGQAKIDVTGRARNVLKRLQVRMPINQIGSSDNASTTSRANFSAEAQIICKQFMTNRDGTDFSNSSSPALCDLTDDD